MAEKNTFEINNNNKQQ